jgi:RimJ/RimL family protein N-acetyltransferase
MSYGWEGSKVRLAPLDKQKHLENVLLWFNDPEITQWTLIGDWPLTRLAEEDFFDRMMRSEQTELVLAIETIEGEHIGVSGIHQIDWRNGVGRTGTIIGRKEYWGQGYGSDAVQARTRYAFEVMGLRLLLSEVMVGNVGSLKALHKAGYREVGRIPRRYWKRGAYRDVILLMVDRESWPA